MIEKAISANLYQKFFILCNTILLNVFHNMSATGWLPWQHSGSRPPQYERHFWPPLVFPFDICKWCLICLIQQAYKNVSSSLWPHLKFCELKITNILKSRKWGLEKSELPWGQNFYSRRCVSFRTISLQSFNGLHHKVTKIASFKYLLDIKLCWVCDIISDLICIFYTFFKLKYLWNQCKYLQTVTGVFVFSWNSMYI